MANSKRVKKDEKKLEIVLDQDSIIKLIQLQEEWNSQDARNTISNHK